MGPRATRRPIAGLSHNHADPDPRTNDRGETTLGPPTQFDHWTLYLNAAQANLKFPSQFFAGFGAVTFPRDSRCGGAIAARRRVGSRAAPSDPAREGPASVTDAAPTLPDASARWERRLAAFLRFEVQENSCGI